MTWTVPRYTDHGIRRNILSSDRITMINVSVLQLCITSKIEVYKKCQSVLCEGETHQGNLGLLDMGKILHIQQDVSF